MAWTTLQNSTTADANVVNDNFYYTRQGHLSPLGGTSLGYTDATFDLGGTPSGTSASYRWRDLYLSRDARIGRYILAGPASTTGYNIHAGFIRYASGQWPNSPTITQIIIPPMAAEIRGQIYHAVATQTLAFATASDWVTNNINGLTASTFTWVYLIPTTTGGLVAKLDDRAPTTVFDSLSSGLYHPGTGASGSTSYRAIHAIRSDTTATVIPYTRRDDKIMYHPDKSNAHGMQEQAIGQNSLTTVRTFNDVPNYAQVKSVILQVLQEASTSTAMQTGIRYSLKSGQTVGAVLAQYYLLGTGRQSLEIYELMSSNNSMYLDENNAANVSTTVYTLGYRFDWGGGDE